MAFRLAAVIWSVVALGLNAYLHFSLAPQADSVTSQVVTGQTVSLGALFRAESIVDIVVALLVLVHPRRWTGALVVLVAGVGLALTVASVYTSITLPFGLPEAPQGPWSREKLIATVAQAIAILGGLFIMARGRPRRR
jgi:hypothetical protein